MLVIELGSVMVSNGVIISSGCLPTGKTQGIQYFFGKKQAIWPKIYGTTK